MKKIITFIFLLSSVVFTAQINIESILEGNNADASKLLKGYLEPFPSALGYGMNTGWYSTAKTQKILGFSLDIVAIGGLIPEENETFTFNNSDYQNISLNGSGTSAELPTFFGSQNLNDRPLLDIKDGNGNTFSTSALPGAGLREAIGFNAVPYAAVQLGVGIFKNTDLKVRWLPKQSGEEYEVSAYGFGIMHDLKQWIPVVNKLPFSLSAFLAWDNITTKTFFDADNNPSQAIELNTSTFVYQLVASKKLAFLTVYGGIGSTSYNSDLNLLGTYNTSNNGNLTNPVELDYKGSSFRANVGFSVKLLFLNLNAGYTMQEYNAFNVGIGFKLR